MQVAVAGALQVDRHGGLLYLTWGEKSCLLFLALAYDEAKGSRA